VKVEGDGGKEDARSIQDLVVATTKKWRDMAFLRLLVTDQEMKGRSEIPIQTLVELMKSLSALWSQCKRDFLKYILQYCEPSSILC